jgi:hypothetical protein
MFAVGSRSMLRSRGGIRSPAATDRGRREEHRVHGLRGPDCAAQTRADLPTDVPQPAFGPPWEPAASLRPKRGSIEDVERRVMRKLIALLVAAGALAAVVVFWRRDQHSWMSTWCSDKDSRCSWGKTSAHETGKAGDGVSGTAEGATDAASDLADEVRSA